MRDSAEPIICTACDREIKHGAEYIADIRQHEQLGQSGAIQVQDTTSIATYHPGCVPHGPGHTRELIGAIIVSVALLILTWGTTIPAWLLYAVLATATSLLCRANAARRSAIRHADEQQRRAQALADPRRPTLRSVLHCGPRDEHVGHTDREAVLARLGDRYASGHLDADEFETRATEATNARTRGQLAHVLRDLP